MSDTVWYYARGEQEKGPITTVQIKALAAAGKLQKEDYVWKEGLDNWVPAGEVPGLFSAKSAPAANSDVDVSTKQGLPRPAALPRTAGVAGGDAQTRTISRMLFVAGLLMALLSRGCDSLGDRNVARRKALSESARREFQDTWDRKRAELQIQQQRLQAKATRTNAENSQLQEMTTAIGKMDAERTEQERALELGAWLEYEQAASRAISGDRIWGYWRQATLLVATMLLTLGAVGVAYSSDGAERWISFVLLVVICYSLFAAQSVWSRVFTIS